MSRGKQKDQHNLHPHRLVPAATDDTALIEMLGTKGYTDDVPLAQYVAWAVDTGLFALLRDRAPLSMEDVVERTPLTEAGADAVIGVLATLGMIQRQGDGLELSLSTLEFLVPGSPYYQGDSMYVTCRHPMPTPFVKPGSDVPHAEPSWLGRRVAAVRKKIRGWEFGGKRILQNQHSRNLPSCVAAAHLPIFDDVQCVLDLAGGTGPFSIPLAQRLPNTRVILGELPAALANVRVYLEEYGVADRVETIALDAFDGNWPVPELDAVFVGNLAHGFEDDRLVALAAEARKHLKPGGCLVLHELVWNPDKDGPLKCALWNVTMREFGGRQRTQAEWLEFLEMTGFDECFDLPTSGGFHAIGGRVPG